MKKVIYIIITLVIGIILNSCNKDPDLRQPELQDAVAPFLVMTENSDIYVDLNDVDGFTLELRVDILFEDPFQKIAVVVVMNGDFENRYTLIDNITSVPQTVTITTADIVGVVEGLNASSEIVQGDEFVVFTVVTMPDGSAIPGYTENGDIAYSSSMVNTLAGLKNGATFDINVPVPCPFDINDWVGTFDFADPNYPSENQAVQISLDPGVENGLIVEDLWFYVPPVPFHIVMNPADFTVTWEEQIIGDDMWGYGPGTADAGSGTFNTCTFRMDLAPSVCVSLGCFGNLPFSLTKQQ